MTYRELNEKLFDLFADAEGNLEGDPVEFLYEMNKSAGNRGSDAQVDEKELNALLKSFGLYKRFYKGK